MTPGPDHVEHDPGLEHEPHLKGLPPDSTEPPIEPGPLSSRPESGVPSSGGGGGGDPEMSVADEPATAWAGIDRTRTPGYAEHLAERTAATSTGIRLLAILLAAAAAGPLAIFGALAEGLVSGLGRPAFMAIVVFGPVAEEMMKVAAILWLVERKPWLVPGAAAIVFVAALGGLGFAAIENVIYLEVYFPNPDPELFTWRWTICLWMHCGCSLFAGLGVARVWRAVIRTGQPAKVAAAFPFFLTAILIHGGYNALAVILSMFGVSP